MDLTRYRMEAEAILKQEGGICALEFAGPTYQVEVHDFPTRTSNWPFLQFTEEGSLKDAFCSCEYEGGCPHLTAAYLKIMEQGEPLHKQFASSLWNRLFFYCFEHFGAESTCLEKQGSCYLCTQEERVLVITPKSQQGTAYLEQLFGARSKQTPENSIKFSNLSAEEIARWKEGRPSLELRYMLSFWFDMAQGLFLQQVDKASYQITFEENAHELPTTLMATFPTLEIRFRYPEEDLPQFIPAFNSVASPLKVFQETKGTLTRITFDVTQKALHLEHAQTVKQEGETRTLPGWIYKPKEGFYATNGSSLLNHDWIFQDQIGEALEEHRQQIVPFIPIHPTPIPVRYHMSFDQQWTWHFEAFLFEPQDLQQGVLIGKWAYLPDKGFIPIEGVLFEQAHAKIAAAEVSSFVNTHRIWLNAQEGFQTHLASIESHLSFSVKEGCLLFYSKMQEGENVTFKDFGDWVYYRGQGFFSKQHARLGHVVRPGLELHANQISSFIKINREELENVSGFFSALLPLQSRGLEVGVQSSSALYVKPLYTLLPGFTSAEVHFFGDFVFVAGHGFYELPLEMRLPEGYNEERVISGAAIHTFLAHEFVLLSKSIHVLDPRLHVPHRTDVLVRYLVRHPKGGLKMTLVLCTEHGEVPVTELLEALQKKKSSLFSSAGLLDLKEERFQWLQLLKGVYSVDQQTLEMPTLNFLRLDAMVNLLGPTDTSASSQVTMRLLKELREFTVLEKPNLEGLKSELRLYQQTGLHWLWFLYKNGLSALLCDDMGLGKTHQAMALMAAVRNIKEHPLFLVVCPTSVIYHWQDKLEQFLPTITVHTFHGLKRSLEKAPKEGVLLTSYGILRMEKEALQKISFDIAIFDEIQVAKNPQSQVHGSLKAINCAMRLGLTGTPIENNLRELKALFDIVLPGYFPSDARFREQFVTPIEGGQDEEKKGLLTQMIRPFILRRRKSEVLQELPEKCVDKAYCDLTPQQAQAYQQMLEQHREGLVAQLRDPLIEFKHEAFKLFHTLTEQLQTEAARNLFKIEIAPAYHPTLFQEMLSQINLETNRLIFDDAQTQAPTQEHKPPPPLTHAPKVGRNNLCPCNSGKKYKKCCGATEEIV